MPIAEAIYGAVAPLLIAAALLESILPGVCSGRKGRRICGIYQLP